MAGTIKRMIEQIVRERSHGDETLAMTTRTKLLLKGIDSQQYSAMSGDDPIVIERIKKVAKELGVNL